MAEHADDVTTRLAAAIGAAGHTVGVAESLTGGALSARLACAPGAGEWYRGAIVSYATGVKRDVLGVPDVPVVSHDSVTAMADGACRVLGADIALAVTGVAGPGDQDGVDPGTVWIALRIAGSTMTRCLDLEGTPPEIVDATCDATLEWLLSELEISV